MARRGSTLHPARQERSRATEERIVAAATSLLEKKRFDQIQVAEIARRAGISVGGFYARFKNKEALLHWFDERFSADIVQTVTAALDPVRCADCSAAEVIRIYVSIACRGFHRHQDLLVQIASQARITPDSTFRERISKTNRILHGTLRDRLLERVDEIQHPHPRRAIDLGLLMASATMREVILFGAYNRESFRLPPRRSLVDEVVLAYSSYLGIHLSDRSARSHPGKRLS